MLLLLVADGVTVSRTRGLYVRYETLKDSMTTVVSDDRKMGTTTDALGNNSIHNRQTSITPPKSTPFARTRPKSLTVLSPLAFLLAKKAQNWLTRPS